MAARALVPLLLLARLVPQASATLRSGCRNISGTYATALGDTWLVAQTECKVQMVVTSSMSGGWHHFHGMVKGDKVSVSGDQGHFNGSVLRNGNIDWGVIVWTRRTSASPAAPSPPAPSPPAPSPPAPSPPAPSPPPAPPTPAPAPPPPAPSPPPAPPAPSPPPPPSPPATKPTTTTPPPAPAPTTSSAAKTTTARPPASTTTSRRTTTAGPPKTTTAARTDRCVEPSRKGYSLDWSAQGRSFFDGFSFENHDANHGAAQYLDRADAEAAGVARAYSTHSILGLGSRMGRYKRQSAKIATKRTWKYFLATVRYTNVPQGCGIWPAIWTHAPAVRWPDGGELDLLEYVNDVPSQTSFHTGWPNRCRMDASLLNRQGCAPMPDLNGMSYDCLTDYPDHLGCAPNTLPVWPGALWSQRPGVLAMEWTEAFVKIFRIPEAEIPADLAADEPRPDAWDRWVIAYYPFAASERLSPGSCPNPADVMAPQQLIFNIGLCGDWASKVWGLSGSCAGRMGPKYPGGCRATDPLKEYDPDQDCCTQFVWDGEGQYGADEYFARQGYFNISWVKVYQ